MWRQVHPVLRRASSARRVSPVARHGHAMLPRNMATELLPRCSLAVASSPFVRAAASCLQAQADCVGTYCIRLAAERTGVLSSRSLLRASGRPMEQPRQSGSVVHGLLVRLFLTLLATAKVSSTAWTPWTPLALNQFGQQLSSSSNRSLFRGRRSAYGPARTVTRSLLLRPQKTRSSFSIRQYAAIPFARPGPRPLSPSAVPTYPVRLTPLCPSF